MLTCSKKHVLQLVLTSCSSSVSYVGVERLDIFCCCAFNKNSVILPYAALETIRKMARLTSVCMHRNSEEVIKCFHLIEATVYIFECLWMLSLSSFLSLFFVCVFPLGYEASVNV